jgi:hypothetical protein
MGKGERLAGIAVDHLGRAIPDDNELDPGVFKRVGRDVPDHRLDILGAEWAEP